MRKARSVSGSSSQRAAYQEAKPVGLAARRVDQHPVLAVGDQAEPHAGTAQQFGHAGGAERRFQCALRERACRAPGAAGRTLISRRGLPPVAVRAAHDQVRPQRLAVLGDGDRRVPRGIAWPSANTSSGIPACSREDEAHPGPVDSRVGRRAPGFAATRRRPARRRRARVRVVRVQSLRKDAQQHRQGRETGRRPRSARAIRRGGGQWTSASPPACARGAPAPDRSRRPGRGAAAGRR